MFIIYLMYSGVTGSFGRALRSESSVLSFSLHVFVFKYIKCKCLVFAY